MSYFAWSQKHGWVECVEAGSSPKPIDFRLHGIYFGTRADYYPEKPTEPPQYVGEKLSWVLERVFSLEERTAPSAIHPDAAWESTDLEERPYPVEVRILGKSASREYPWRCEACEEWALKEDPTSNSFCKGCRSPGRWVAFDPTTEPFAVGQVLETPTWLLKQRVKQQALKRELNPIPAVGETWSLDQVGEVNIVSSFNDLLEVTTKEGPATLHRDLFRKGALRTPKR